MEKEIMFNMVDFLLDYIVDRDGVNETISLLYDAGFSVKELEEFFNKDDIMYAIDLYKEAAEENGEIVL